MSYIEIIGSNYPLVQCHILGDPTIYENLVWDAGDPIPPKEDLDNLALDTIKRRIWEEIKVFRDARYNKGVLVGEKWYHTDEASRIKYIGLLLMGLSMPGNIQWKTMDGSFITMTPVLIQAVFYGIANNDSAIFQNGEVHKAALYASNDPTNYDYSTGWPDIYEE